MSLTIARLHSGAKGCLLRDDAQLRPASTFGAKEPLYSRVIQRPGATPGPENSSETPEV